MFQTDGSIVPQIRLQLLSSGSLPVDYSVIILLLNAVERDTVAQLVEALRLFDSLWCYWNVSLT